MGITEFNMKRILFLLMTFFILLNSCEQAEDVVDTTPLLSYVDDNFNEDNGYVDVSEFYFEHNFKELKNVISVKILVSTESSNFDEIGVFEFENERSAKRSVKFINEYVDGIVANFKNGVIYDIKEYPKFENASVIRSSHIVIYTVLDKNKSEPIIDLAKK